MQMAVNVSVFLLVTPKHINSNVFKTIVVDTIIGGYKGSFFKKHSGNFGNLVNSTRPKGGHKIYVRKKVAACMKI